MNVQQHISQAYLTQQPSSAARSLENLREANMAEQVELLDEAVLTPVLELMATAPAVRVFTALSMAQKISVLAAASPRLSLLLLDGIDKNQRAELMNQLPEAVSQDLARLQQYAENTAGRLMDRPFETIRGQDTVAEVLDLLRLSSVRHARSLYVVDEANRLCGRVDMQSLALASPDDLLADLMVEIDGSVLATAGREEIVETLNRLRVDSIPVVDVDGRLMGIVRYQRLFEAIESVASADLQKMVGASADERALSSAGFAVKRRLPWLHINLLTAFLAAAVVGLFENLIAQFTALAVLLPVVAGQSGNAGSQALAVTMRGLALREIGTRHWRGVLNKEVWVGVIDGFALAITCGLGVFVWSQSFGLALVIGVAMILSMIAAGIAGALVPIVLTRLGQDPATAASIILTTVTDVAGFFAFLGTATLLSTML